MLLLVALLRVSLLPATADLQDLINNKMYSCVRDIAFCRRHSPNLRNNIWNFAFSKLYSGLYKDTLPKPDKNIVEKIRKEGVEKKEEVVKKEDEGGDYKADKNDEKEEKGGEGEERKKEGEKQGSEEVYGSEKQVAS